MAAPTKYNPETTDKIIDLISTTNRSLTSICKEVDISTMCFFKWLADPEKKELLVRYTLAKEVQAEMLIEELLEIADESDNDTLITESGAKANNEWINRSRLRVDTRKWIASKLLPKKYGDKLGIDLSSTEIVVIPPKTSNDASS
jgi:hypothetical protein